MLTYVKTNDAFVAVLFTLEHLVWTSVEKQNKTKNMAKSKNTSARAAILSSSFSHPFHIWVPPCAPINDPAERVLGGKKL